MIPSPHRSVLAGARAPVLALSFSLMMACGSSATRGAGRAETQRALVTSGNEVVWINPQISGTAGACLGPLTVQLEDDTSTPINAPAGGEGIDISSSNGSGQFFIDSSCQISGFPAAIPAGSSTVDVYYEDSATADITVADTTSAFANIQTVDITPDAGSPDTTPDAGTLDAGTTDAGTGNGNQVAWSDLTPITAHAGDCIPLTVQLEDSTGVPINAASAETFTVSTPTSGLFFPDATCSTTSATSFTILAGDGSLPVYYKDFQSGTPWLSVTNDSGNVSTVQSTILNGPATHLVASGYPATITPGVTMPLTVTAYDFYDNVAVDYAGTVNVSSDDTAATNPPAHTFNPSVDFGHFDFDFAFASSGTFTLTATDTGNNWSATEPNIQVVQASSGNAVRFEVSGFPASQTAGVSAPITVTPVDFNGDPAVGYRGTINFSYVGPNGAAQNPSSYTFTTDGPQPFTLVFTTAASFDVTVTDATNTDLTGRQSGIQITPATVERFDFALDGQTFTAGTVNPITIFAHDVYGNLATNYTGSISLHNSDPKGTSVASLPFPVGTGQVTVNVEFDTAGLQMLRATDPNINAQGDNSPSIPVVAAKYDHLVLSGLPPSSAAAAQFGFDVSAVDAFGNVVTGWPGTLHFQSSDNQAQVPPDQQFGDLSSDTQTFFATLFTAGPQTVTVSEVGGSSPPSQGTLDITASDPNQVEVSDFPTPTIAGDSHTFDVKIEDAYGNRVTDYAGAMTFSSSDGQASLPLPYTFTGAEGGEKSFTATLKTAGPQTITATAAVLLPLPALRTPTGSSAPLVSLQAIPINNQIPGSISGTQTGIQVDPGAAAVMTVSDFPSVVNAGDTQPVGVRVFDAFGNPATGYRGAVRLTSSDPLAVFDSPFYVFNANDNGSHPFHATLRTPGIQTISAHDLSVTTLTASETGISVVDVPPVIVADAIGTAGVNLPYPYNARGRITTTGGLPTGYASCGGPPEFRVDPHSGVVSWTPTTTGSVNLCVIASNGAGSSAAYNFTVQVSQPTGAAPVAQIAATPNAGPGPLDVTLDGSGSTADPSTSIVAYRWRFGDGSAPRVGSNVSHTYQVEGGYQAMLEVVDGFGRIGIAAQAIRVDATSGKRPPSAHLVASVYSGTGPLTVNFSCDCQAGDAPIKAWHWDAGDQSQDGETPSFSFTPGVHNVHLTVIDANGLTATDSATITVSNGSNTPPTCHLYATEPAGQAPLDVTLAADVRPGSGAISEQKITVSDGTTSTEEVVAKSLQLPGFYTATLSVTDANGDTCSDTVSMMALAAGNIVPPHIVSAAQAASLACSGYEYDALASGSRPLTWKLVAAGTSPSMPAGLTVDSQSGALKLAAAPAFSQPIEATLVVSNSAGQDSQSVHLDPGACQLSANVGCDASAGDAAGLLWMAPGLLWFLRRRRGAEE